MTQLTIFLLTSAIVVSNLAPHEPWKAVGLIGLAFLAQLLPAYRNTSSE